MQIHYNPLVMWVWIGGIILGLGTIIAMLPNKKSAPRKRVTADVKEEKKEIEASVS